MTKRIFVSYARVDRPVVEHLAGDLHRAGYDCFFDEDLVGGQDWWDALMDQIERCDVFLPALSAGYLRSVPCAHEATYASELGKPFLPVTLEADVPASMCPPRVAESQWVAYDPTGRDVILELMAALNAMPPGPPLPAELPPRPEVPISYLTDLKARIEQPGTLGWEDQNLILAELRGRLGGDESADVLLLMRRFGQRHDLYEQVAVELRSVIAGHEQEAAATTGATGATAASDAATPAQDVDSGPPAPPPPPYVPMPPPGPAEPVGSSGTTRRWWVLVGALALVLVVVGVVLALRSNDSSTTSPPPTEDTTDPQAEAFAVGLSWFFTDNSATTAEVLPSDLASCTQSKLSDDDVAAIAAVKVNRDDDHLADALGIRVVRGASRCNYDGLKDLLVSSLDLSTSGLIDSDQESCVATSVLGQISSVDDSTVTGSGGEWLQPVVITSLQACVPMASVLPAYLSQLGVPDAYIDCATTQSSGMVTWDNLLTHSADAELESIVQWCASQG